jgi:hypothetical protein
MSKRVDFSLGMSGISSGAEMGDVYDKPKPRVPPSAGAAAARRSVEMMEEEEGAALASTTSRESAETAGSRSRRLFSRRGRGTHAGEGGVVDLEAGPLVGAGVVELKELSREHLPGIPEVTAPGVGPSRLGAVEGEVMTSGGVPTVRTRTGPLGHQDGVDEGEVSMGRLAGLSATAEEEVEEGKSK